MDFKFDKFKLEIELEAETPLIHFQGDQDGATLRATEVKPKLDKFLIKCFEKKHKMDKKQIKEKFKDCFITGDKDALDYKLSFKVNTDDKRNKIVRIGVKKAYKIYYGNMGDGPKKKGVFSYPTMTLICFNNELRHVIEENIQDFLILTNFGTMQNKGFGGFIPHGYFHETLTSDEVKSVASVMKEYTGNPVYSFKYSGKAEPSNEMAPKALDIIKSYYEILKSGRNYGGYTRSFLFEYMHNTNYGNKKNIGNEKAFIKKISPNIGKSTTKPPKGSNIPEEEDYRYVRAMLGICENIQYIRGLNAEDRHKGKARITISHEQQDGDSKKIERLNSPIYFKVIKNYIFIMANDIPDEIYDTTFKLSNDEGHGKLIKTPKKDEFNLNELLERYMEYFNENKNEYEYEYEHNGFNGASLEVFK